ncbi:uncharacterized protein LOC127122692 [Lathyrus oleraceus]|uniref:uncharacterized protein LOC127122692 n=1 Tax=Pisum sativum TaxID=3888 RepID=UPI0021CEBF07|nr:uncharacterized protein LOC127122692 [Pisum sativum]
MEDVTVDVGKPLNAKNLKSMGVIDRVLVRPTLDTSYEALKDQRKIPNGMYLFSKIDPPKVIAYYLQDLASQGVNIFEFSVDWLPEQPPNFMKRKRGPPEKSKKKKTLKLREPFVTRSVVPLDSSASSKSYPSKAPLNYNLNQISSYLPQPLPTYSPSEPTISIQTPSKPHISDTNTPSAHVQKFNLETITLPLSEVRYLNESISPPSSTPSSPIYYEISSDSEQTEIHDHSSPTLAQLQAIAHSEQPSSPPSKPPTEPPSEPPIEPSKTIHTPSEPINPTFEPEPTLKESFSLLLESSAVKLRTLSKQSNLSDNPLEVRTRWNGFLRWMTSEVFKLKGLSK